MKTVETIRDVRVAGSKLPKPIGLVPTMGYLHKGHLSLVHSAHQECASVVVSIFVNPTQFGPQEDLGAYPRDLGRDQAMLADVGVDLLWTPSAEEIYPADYQTWVTVDDITRFLEGAARPGHFRGVSTVVTKLFNVVQPQKAYFGQKDAQQVAVIRRMVADLNFPVEIIVCPTVREPDGLAMSSRNIYLTAQERQAAVVLYRALQAAKSAYWGGEKSAENLLQAMRRILAEEPLARPEYVSCAHPGTLHELEEVQEGALLSLAVKIGKTRLIDNLLLKGEEKCC